MGFVTNGQYKHYLQWENVRTNIPLIHQYIDNFADKAEYPQSLKHDSHYLASKSKRPLKAYNNDQIFW